MGALVASDVTFGNDVEVDEAVAVADDVVGAELYVKVAEVVGTKIAAAVVVLGGDIVLGTGAHAIAETHKRIIATIRFFITNDSFPNYQGTHIYNLY
jgi:hypothetical protein